ncbi:hypothetical protein DCW30_04470 [Streptomyces alfalfae]|uniref:Transposase for insertion sequence element IS21-like C-terminal domain-containing protein n=1 Tax=Streptomyces alfalfae TaxID=1642299 RepID=A0ABM6GLE2_9ACTN|nr:hypothetical protein [Streptomyces alfalfae]APY84478.1 hypothetical protein A7J05_00585 [Streptomyces alfalfae]AYA14974.1 hypothetical protein D3X13_00625 [Streptomyces fradiae]RXX46942.1 hypothetical protein DCW30_04470 [Streptomyces alfalfae]RZM81357.1 hypothetical protein D4104_35055 [Streptomyces alfalfae]
MRTITQDFAREVGHLLPLPDDPFATGITLTPRVDRYGMITVRMCRYSVPVRFIDRKVTVTLTCDDLTVYDGRREIARHRRQTERGAELLVLDHYLERGRWNAPRPSTRPAPRTPSRPSMQPSGPPSRRLSATPRERKPW